MLTRLKHFNERVTVEQLIQASFCIFAAGGVGVYLLHRRAKMGVQRFEHYKEAMEMLEENEQGKELLGGEPIRYGFVNVYNRKHNFVGKTESKFKIPVHGPQADGFLYVLARRKSPAAQFSMERLLLDVDAGNERLLIFDREAAELAAANEAERRRREEQQRKKRPRLTR